MKRVRAITVEHGNVGRYSNHGCRCRLCTDAATAKHLKARQRRKKKLSEAPHGTYGGYSNWGCRCDDCRAANTEHAKRYNAERRKREAA